MGLICIENHAELEHHNSLLYAVYAINSLLYLEFHPTMALTVYFDDARCVFFCVKLSLKAWGFVGKRTIHSSPQQQF